MARKKVANILDSKNLDAETKKELEEKLAKMTEDRDNKCKAAKDQLVEMLKITADKYRTATGTAEALRVYRFANANDNKFERDITEANNIAHSMAEGTEQMMNRAIELSYEEMDQLCDGFYDKNFTITRNDSCVDKLVFEMMKIDLCRNVGGSAEDMVSFVKRSQEEIDATEKALKELEE